MRFHTIPFNLLFNHLSFSYGTAAAAVAGCLEVIERGRRQIEWEEGKKEEEAILKLMCCI